MHINFNAETSHYYWWTSWHEPIIITKHGKPVMVTVSYEQMESLLETLEILEDKEFASQLATSIKQDRNRETISWSDAQAKLGW